MRLILALLGLAASASAAATTYSLKVIAPGRQTDGETLHASRMGFLTGLEKPSTHCPQGMGEIGACSNGTETLVRGQMRSMAVNVAGGQAIYIAENGAVSYTPPHSGNKGKNPIVGGWYSKKMKSNCANPVTVVDWIEPGPKDRTRTGGLVMCPVKFPNSTAKYKLYANTRAFDQKDCKAIVGIQEVANEASFGAWAYW